MNTTRINAFLKDVPNFIGTYPSDMLPAKVERPFSLICNLDDSYSEGSHWVAIFIEANGDAYFFDSYGREPPPQDIEEYLFNNGNSVAYSPLTLQAVTSEVCGHYVILFIYLMSYGVEYCTFLSLFNRNPTYNDLLVKSIVNSIDPSI